MGKLRVLIFNVEQGFCAFIRTPNDYTLLIDCGSTQSFSPIKYIAENELVGAKTYNGHKLTKFVLSHPHDDHLTDIERLKGDLSPGIMKRHIYNWDDVKTGDKDLYHNLDVYSGWQKSYNQSLSSTPDWGANIYHGESLTPEEAKLLGKGCFVNNSSISTFIEYKNWKISFHGDLESNAWIELLKNDNFKNSIANSSFFVASHHGHSSGFCKEIFQTMGKPHFNIVSANSGDESIEPSYSKPEYSRGVAYNNKTRYMFSTRSEGHILLEIDEEGKATFDFLKIDDNLVDGVFW
ncbi:MAG: MBL fold metallo-hydrolase [Candidatus Margulisiibacteriota bacterium]|nr:MBL fold metallo-hydrolase [Candidatus Margulisiibacteriota bacterium]